MALHDTGAQLEPERVVLFGIVPHGDPRSAKEALGEMERLADTCGFVVVDALIQHRRAPDQNYYLGRGKLEEVKDRIAESNAQVAICDDQLSPSQGRNVEKFLGVPTVDRSEVILRIFDTHAKTPQAKLQVELAQLHYQLPRLKRLWTHLERQRGGIGLRGGMGEKQIDVDRSELRSKIALLNKKLRQIESHRQVVTSHREDQFTLALVGYTNAGKSTLMNRLTGADVLVQNQLFSTLDTRTRPWRFSGGRTVLLSDTVGFIHKLPHQLVASFHATLDEALHSDALLFVVDASDPGAIDQLKTVESVLEDLGAGHIPKLFVLNKSDQVAEPALLAPLYSHAPRAVPVSARTGAGIAELEAGLQEYLATREETVRLLVPHTLGGLRGEVRHAATVVDEEHRNDGSILTVNASQRTLRRLLAKGAQRLEEGEE